MTMTLVPTILNNVLRVGRRVAASWHLDRARRSVLGVGERLWWGTLAALALTLALSHSAAAAPADISRATQWLQGRLAGGATLIPSAVATDDQSRCEAAATLIALGANDNAITRAIADMVVQGDGVPTETLACARALGRADADNPLQQRRLGSPSYGAYPGDASSSTLDTAWALLATGPGLSPLARDGLIQSLAAQQAPDGSFALHEQPSLWTTAAVLRALTPLVTASAQAATVASRAASWLLSRQSSPGVWGDDLILTAAAFVAVHPYSAAQPDLGNQTGAWLLARQQTDGSWAGDTYVTAVVLRALALSGAAVQDPLKGSIVMRFVDARTSAPLPSVSVTGAGSATFTSDSGGLVRMSNLNAGGYRLMASLNGFATVSLAVSLAPGQSSDLGVVQMVVQQGNSTTAVISGTVRDGQSSQALAGVTVSVDGQPGMASTGADGRYVLSGVSPGSITVRAGKPGYFGSSAQANVAAGQMLVFSPILSVSESSTSTGTPTVECRIAGGVTEAGSGQAIAGATVNISGASIFSAITDAGGRYSAGGLSSGPLSIAISKPGYDAANALTDVRCDALRSVLLDFSPALFPAGTAPADANKAGLNGVVVDATSNQPIAGASLSATTPQGVSRSATSGADGRFVLAGLDGAWASLAVLATGYQGVTLQFALSPGVTADLGQLRLMPPTVTQLRADLKVLQVVRASARTDAQSLVLAGTVSVSVGNGGTAPSQANVPILAFADSDGDGLYTSGVDAVVGQGLVVPSLAPYQSATLPIAVNGLLSMRDGPIHVVVDPAQQYLDANRANDVGNTGQPPLALPGGAFAPELKWHWDGAPRYPGAGHSIMTPLVGRIEDTNGDGRIDSEDRVRVVFVGYTGRYYQGPGTIFILDGSTGAEVRAIADSSGDPYKGVSTNAQLVLADIDNDGKADIIALTWDGEVVAYEVDGRLKWRSPSILGRGVYDIWSAPSVADLDGDGNPEIIVSRYVLTNTGSLKWAGTGRHLGGTHDYRYRPLITSSVVTDLFGSGSQNVIVGPSVYTAQGTLLWEDPEWFRNDGFAAVGRFGNDTEPSIVVTQSGFLAMYSRMGVLKWRVAIPGGLGGPPTLADADGDGSLDIGVAGASTYAVFRANGSVLWSIPTYDYSSGVTGATFFDFDGDGRAEVLYADEQYVRVMDGRDGTERLSFENSSQTALEIPVVADIDGDGQAEFLVVSQWTNPWRPNPSGLRAYKDVNNAWVGARSVWNQHAYSITNINDDLSVPRNPVPSWQSHNTFRLNKRIDGDPRGVPDLTVGYARVADGGSSQPSQVTWRVGNAGGYRTMAGATVALYGTTAAGSSSLLATQSLAIVQPGQYSDISFALASLAGQATLTLVADDDGSGRTRAIDFDRSNNRHAIDLSEIATAVRIGVTTDRPVYAGRDIVAISAAVTNAGSFAKTAQVRLSILDTQGRVVAVLAPPPAVTVGAGATEAALASWSTEGILAGPYAVRAELVTSQGVVYGQATAGFTITDDLAGGSVNRAEIRADRSSYSAAQPIALDARVANLSSNTLQENLRAVTTVRAADASLVYSRTETIAQLAPGGQRPYSYSLGAGTLVAGSYLASVQLLHAGDSVLAQATTGFVVQDTSQSGVGVQGQLQAQPARVVIGQPAQLLLSVTNRGDTALGGAPVTVRIVDPVAGTLTAQFSADASALAAGHSRSYSFDWTSQGTDGQTLVAVATITINGRDITLAQTNLTLVGEPRLVVRPTALNFSAEPGTSHTASFTVVSTGTAAVSSVSVNLSATASSFFTVLSNGCGAASLPAGGQCAVVVRYAPTTAGSHSATVTVQSGNAGSASVALSGVAVASQPTGTISASPNPAPLGQTVSLLYAVSNPASSTLSAQLSVSVRNSQGLSLQSWPLTATIGAQAIHRGNVAYTAPASAQTLTAVLSAVIASNTTVLSTTTLVIQGQGTSATLQLSALNDPRMLVLVACNPGDDDDDDREHGKSLPTPTEQLRTSGGQSSGGDDDDDDDEEGTSACKAERSAAIARWLHALGVEHTIVTDEARFLHEMRCGRYNSYWVSGGALKLQSQTLQELREAHWRGAALWVDGAHDSRNKTLIETLGLVWRGKLPQSNPLMSYVNGSPLGQGSVTVPGKADRFNTQGATAHATFNAQGTGERVPAIATHAWGAGRSIAFAFEMAVWLQQHDPARASANGVRQLLTQALAVTRPSVPTRVQLGEEVVIGLRLHNPDTSSRRYRVLASVPAGLTHTGATPAPDTGPGGLSWTVSVPAGTQSLIAWRVRVEQSGNQRITVQVADADAASSAPALLTRSFELAAPVPGDELSAAISAVQSQPATSGRDRSARDRALSDARAAQSLFTSGRYRDAAERWVDALQDLQDVSLDTRVAHDALSYALSVTTRAHCRSLRCLTGVGQASSTTPELGSTVQLSARLNNACTVAVDKAPLQLRLTNPRLGQTLLDDTPRISVGPRASATYGSSLRLKSPTRAGDELLLDLSIDWQGHRIPLDVLPLTVR